MQQRNARWLDPNYGCKKIQADTSKVSKLLSGEAAKKNLLEIKELVKYQLLFSNLGSVNLREAKLNQVNYFQIFEANSSKWNCNIDKKVRADGSGIILINGDTFINLSC